VPIYTVQGPDGKTYTVEGPAGATADQVGAFVMSQQQAPAQPVKEAGQSLNRGLSDIPRQIGLTARYALEGPAQAAQIFTEPIAGLMRLGGITTPPLGEVASGLADKIGFPKPESAQERVVGDAARLLAGTGGMLGASRAAANLPGMMGTIGAGMAANPTAQIASATGAGTLGGISREGGGDELQQAGAALIGGVAGGMVPGVANAATNVGKRLLNQLTPQQMDMQISNVLQRAGMDYGQVPERVRQSLRTQMQNALRAEQELDPAAVRRLAEFNSIGATPTRGMITQDPVRITQEMNLAKMGASSADDGLQGLARIQNQNNTRLINVMNEAGANRGDPFAAGQKAIGAIQGRDADLASKVTGLYQQARDTSGRSAALDGVAFTQRASQMLDEGLLGGALPKDVENHLNLIAQGKVPFTVDYAEQLKTRIAALQRATNDGSARMALGTVRSALEETPLMQGQEAGKGAIGAFNEARQAARQRFGWQESARPIQAALSGAEPDKFVEQFVIRGTLADASAVAKNAPVEEVKTAILAHLKDKALNGSADEVGKFSQSAYNKALNQIGDRKLSLFFSPDEVSQIKTLGRVASYMQNQPVGSAVNNSNSGALLLGKGIDLLNKLPGGQTFFGQPLQNINISMQQRAAQNVLPGLLAPQSRPPLMSGLLAPAAAFSGGLLAPPMAN
jgi:hypothetical protein